MRKPYKELLWGDKIFTRDVMADNGSLKIQLSIWRKGGGFSIGLESNDSPPMHLSKFGMGAYTAMAFSVREFRAFQNAVNKVDEKLSNLIEKDGA